MAGTPLWPAPLKHARMRGQNHDAGQNTMTNYMNEKRLFFKGAAKMGCWPKRTGAGQNTMTNGGVSGGWPNFIELIMTLATRGQNSRKK